MRQWLCSVGANNQEWKSSGSSGSSGSGSSNVQKIHDCEWGTRGKVERERLLSGCVCRVERKRQHSPRANKRTLVGSVCVSCFFLRYDLILTEIALPQ